MAKVLVVIPHDRFRDEELQALLKVLSAKGHQVSIGSSHHTEARGHFGLLVKPDIDVDFVEVDDYDCLVFIGGRGVEEYVYDSVIMNLVRNFNYDRKPIAAIGMAVEILIYAGLVSGKRVTSDNATLPKVQSAGGYYTGRMVEVDGDLITGSGVDASEEFAEEIADYLAKEIAR